MPDVSARRTLTGYLGILLVTIFTGLLLKTFVIDAFVVPSISMEPTLLAGDYVFVNKLLYGARVPRLFHFIGFDRFPGIRRIERGDVVFFAFPDSSSRPYFVKRCAGLPGDRFEFRDRRLYVNGIGSMTIPPGEMLWSGGCLYRIPRAGDVIPISPETITGYLSSIQREGHTVTVANGRVHIDGIRVEQYEFQKNYLFVLGDNINHSYDSRFWGLLPEEDVEGAAMMVYLSRDFRDSKIRWSRIGTFVH